MKKNPCLLLTLCFLAVGYANAQAQNPSDGVILANWAKITQKLHADTILSANFEMESSDRFSTNERISGTLFLWNDGYRIETDQSRMLVYNGVSTVIDATQKQVIISSYVSEDDDFAPAKLLQDDWLAKYTRVVDNKNQSISWVTEDPFENFAEISVQLSTSFPIELVALDQLQNKVVLYLSKQQWLPAKQAKNQALFSLETPNDFELIDLRDEQ
jgi:hypothetical protein